MNVSYRIALLRSLMQEQGVDGYLIYGTDPHLSEYVPDAWRTREWISGFSGSYGKVAITQENIALWTDSRYFIQAGRQLPGSGITLMKDRQSDTISVDCWFGQQLQQGSVVAIDGLSISAAEAIVLEQKLSAKGITFDQSMDLVSRIWKDRPRLPRAEIIDYPLHFAGVSRSEKLGAIRKHLLEAGAEATLVGQLDDLAWCFNLRGNDIRYNPVFTGYGYIDQQQAIIFTDERKMPSVLKNDLEREGVLVINYDSIYSFLKQTKTASFYLDPDRINSLIYKSIANHCKITNGLAIPTLLKSVKNDVEVGGMREAHLRDGAAMVNFLHWLNKNLGTETITELSAAEKLGEFRAMQLNYMGESFCPIMAFGPHGAIVHYNATAETDTEILPDGILLFDSGGQYLDGTTDITRTIATGKVTQQQQTDFTLVLKGMIQLAKAIFPENTKGYSLDTLARKDLWRNGLNYGHGTGHGVGHYLSVHEGPMSIRPESNNEPIRAGQIISNEPGLYRENEYGIRIENVLLCQNECCSNFGHFLSFDTLTLCPIDLKLINRQILNNEEQDWLNAYHAKVFEKLENLLDNDVRQWLKIQCRPV